MVIFWIGFVIATGRRDGSLSGMLFFVYLSQTWWNNQIAFLHVGSSVIRICWNSLGSALKKVLCSLLPNCCPKVSLDVFLTRYAQIANCADYRHLSLGPLDKYIKQHQELLDRRDTILNMAAQICSALDFLESKKIFHGDLVSCDPAWQESSLCTNTTFIKVTFWQIKPIHTVTYWSKDTWTICRWPIMPGFRKF